MRKITEKLATAFANRRSAKLGNTETDGMMLWLHGNLIAVNKGECVIMTLAGYPTRTTRERLNGVCEVIDGSRPFYQHQHEQLFDGMYIEPKSTIIWNPIRRTKSIMHRPIRDVLNDIV